MKPDLAVFDLDGTLLESSRHALPAIAEAIGAVFAARGITGVPPSGAAILAHFGEPASSFYATLLPGIAPEAVAEIQERATAGEFAALEHGAAALFPGVAAYFADSPCPAALVSNCSARYRELFLARFGAHDWFRATACHGDDPALSKGAHAARAIRAVGASRPVFVGDSQSDFDAARENGAPFIHAAYGYGRLRGKPDAVIGEFGALRRLLGL